jgi:hypothetical protein
MALKFLVAAAVSSLLVASVVHAQTPQDETLFMHCSVEGRDGQVSVSFDEEAAYYRFGSIGQAPELEIVSPYASFGPYASPAYIPSGHDIREISETIEFLNGDYSYGVTMGFYDGWIEPGDWDEDRFGKISIRTQGDEEFGSVVVKMNGIKQAEFSCLPETILWNRNAFFHSLSAAGYTWQRIDNGAPVWYENDGTLGVYPYSGLPKSILPFSCPFRDERPIFFSSYETQDILSIKIVGEDCNTADVFLAITTEWGDVIHDSKARALNYTYEYEGADGVRAMLMRFMQGQPQSGYDIPPNDEIQSDPAYFEVDATLVQQARRLDLPLFCHQAGKSYSACFVYIDGHSKLLFMSGS